MKFFFVLFFNSDRFGILGFEGEAAESIFCDPTGIPGYAYHLHGMAMQSGQAGFLDVP